MGTLLRFVWFYKKLLFSNINEVFLRVNLKLDQLLSLNQNVLLL